MTGAGVVWALEWRRTLARRRLVVLNVVVPLLLVAPVALGAAPPAHAAAVYAVLFGLFGTFGSAIPLVRDAEAGLVTRSLAAGVPPGHLLLERAAAGAAVDLIELAPSLAVAALLGGDDGAPLDPVALVSALAGTLWTANLLGTFVAASARSLAEAALFAAVVTLLLLHASGVFRTPAPGGPAAALEAVAPFRALHEALLATVSPTAPSRRGIATLVAWCLALPALAALLAPTLGRRLGHASAEA